MMELWAEQPCIHGLLYAHAHRYPEGEVVERCEGGSRRKVTPTHELMVCVTHWRIYEATRAEPYASFGFHACPIEEGSEHEMVPFVAFSELGVSGG